MNGRKLLLLRPQLVDEKDPTKFRPGSNTIVAVDTVGAGHQRTGDVLPGQQRLLAAGGMKDALDAVVIGIVDTVDVLGKQIYSARQ
jgi:ethanolamine utilization protein EutN